MNEIEINRHNELIDPHLEIWGWEVAAYLYLGGIAAGIMIFGALVALGRPRSELSRWLRWAPIAAPVAVSIGMLCLFLDLEHKLHVYRFYLAFRPASPMSWGSWVLLLIYPATLGWALASLTRSEIDTLAAWRPLKALRLGKILTWSYELVEARLTELRWSNIVLGIVLGLYTGILLGTLEARAAWNTTLLAPLFLVSGLSTGAALLMLLPISKRERHALTKWDMVAIAVEIVLLALFFIDRSTSGAEGHQIFHRFFGGDLTAPFWSLVFVAGLIVPLMLELIEMGRKLRPTLAAPILILVGGLALRWILVHAGQFSPMA